MIRRLLGLHAPPAPYEGLDEILRLERDLGRVDIVHVFQPWSPAPVADFHEEWLRDVHSSGRVPLLTWEPWHLDGGPVQRRFSADRIARGDHDAYVAAWADRLAGLDFEVFIRPLHEMNGDWYPWSLGRPGVGPEDVVAAWRHLHAVFEQAGARNVRWVWSPICVWWPDEILEECYPGRDVVDVLALDGYNWGAGVPEYGGWRDVESVFRRSYERLGRLGDQPIWFAEVGCSTVGGDKAAWVADLLDPTRFPRCAAIVWFNVDKEQDWLLASPPTAAAAWAAGARAWRASPT